MKTDGHQQELPFTPNSNMTYQSNHTFYVRNWQHILLTESPWSRSLLPQSRAHSDMPGGTDNMALAYDATNGGCEA
jgi:hypothetical protein